MREKDMFNTRTDFDSNHFRFLRPAPCFPDNRDGGQTYELQTSRLGSNHFRKFRRRTPILAFSICTGIAAEMPSASFSYGTLAGPRQSWSDPHPRTPRTPCVNVSTCAAAADFTRGPGTQKRCHMGSRVMISMRVGDWGNRWQQQRGIILKKIRPSLLNAVRHALLL